MPGGRPSDIDKIIGTRPTPEGPVDVTVADRILASLRVGAPLYEAADAAGVGRETVRGWIKLAGTLTVQHAGNLDRATLTAFERRCIEFSGSVEEARAAWLIDTLTIHERLARGGIPQEIITVKTDAGGVELERSVRTTATLPSERALEWRMKHLRPDLYSDRLELTGAGGGPIELEREERASALVALAQAFRKKKEPAATPRKRTPPTGAR